MDYYDGLSEKEIHYIDEARIIGRTEEIVLHELVYELEERIQTINPILHIHDISPPCLPFGIVQIHCHDLIQIYHFFFVQVVFGD